MKIIEGKWKDGVIVPLEKIKNNRSSKVFILTDTKKIIELQKKMNKLNIQYFKLLSEFIPEEYVSEKEKKRLEKIIKENKEKEYFSLEEFKKCLK